MRIEFAAIPRPDEIARGDANERLRRLGKLGVLGAWIAACQGQSPPRALKRPRVVVFAADHGVAAKGVSADPPGATRERLAVLRSGTGALTVLAEAAGARVRVVDVAVDSDERDTFKVRRSSGSIDTEDAMTDDETDAAVRAGMRLVDAEVDTGADLLIPAELGVGGSTPAAALVAALTGAEPVAVIGRGSGIDDNGWMRKAATVRDALRRARGSLDDPMDLLRTAGGADLAALTGFLAQAAVRRTPVLLDGLAPAAAGLVAEELAPGARLWWTATHSSTEPAHDIALKHLDREPLLDLGITEGGGIGAVAALPLVSNAVRLLSAKARGLA